MRFLMRVMALACVGSMFAMPLIAQTYRIAKRATLGGEEGWGYLSLDADARRIFAPRETHVMVFDADTLKVVGTIPNTPGVSQVTFAPEFGRGYIANEGNNTVTVFDRKTLKTLGTIRVGDGPNGIGYFRASKQILTANTRSHDLTILDAAQGKTSGSVALGGRPHAMISDGFGNLLVGVAGRNEVVRVDQSRLVATARWSLSPCKQPHGMALDFRNKRLFVACENKRLIVMDSANGKIVSVVPIGAGGDALRFDAEGRIIFTANGDGTLTVIHQDSPDRYRVVQNLATARGARTLTLDRKTHRIYTVAARYDKNSNRFVPGSFEVIVIERAQD